MKNFAIFILILCGQNVFSQVNDKIEITHERDLTGAVTKIIYTDSSTQQIIKEISVMDSDLNPYKDLVFPRIEDPQHKYAYDLSNVDKYELFNTYLINSGYPENEVDKLNFSKAIVFSSVFRYHNFRFISYYLMFKNEEECEVGQNVSLVILDSIGAVFKSINNSNYNYDLPELTNDYRFLSYSSSGGEDIGCYTAYPLSAAFIYDFELQQTIFFKQSNQEYHVNSPVLKEEYDYFVISYSFQNNSGYQYNIVFPYDRVMYSKFYTKSDRKRFVAYRPNGIVLKDSIYGEQLDSFEATFRKTTF